MTTLAAAEHQVSEVMLAWRVCCPEGEQLGGKHLERWWNLAPEERRYFEALLAPQLDPDALTRTERVERTPNTVRIIADPPYPEPCGCVDAPVIPDHNRARIRCCRCLRCWDYMRARVEGDVRPQLRACPTLADNLPSLRAHVAFALEQVDGEIVRQRAAQLAVEFTTAEAVCAYGNQKGFTVAARDQIPVSGWATDSDDVLRESLRAAGWPMRIARQAVPDRASRHRAQLLAELSRPMPKGGT